MISKEFYLKQIVEQFAKLVTQVEILNSISLYDINIMSEDFYAQLLNKVYGYNLINANKLKKNMTAIDLIDDKSQVCFQVTSNNDSEKIKSTIDKFIENQQYQKYKTLYIILLVKKKRYSKKFDTKNLFDFDINKHILDYEDIVKKISEIDDIKKVSEIYSFLSNNLTIQQKSYTTNSNEVQTIIDLIEYLSKNRTRTNSIDTLTDPEYKIKKRFKNFAESLTAQYTTLLAIYRIALDNVYKVLEIDEAKDMIIKFYLQDESIKQLDCCNNNPLNALNQLTKYFENKLSINGKQYDIMAIKFYLLHQIIECNVFPNQYLN